MTRIPRISNFRTTESDEDKGHISELDVRDEDALTWHRLFHELISAVPSANHFAWALPHSSVSQTIQIDSRNILQDRSLSTFHEESLLQDAEATLFSDSQRRFYEWDSQGSQRLYLSVVDRVHRSGTTWNLLAENRNYTKVTTRSSCSAASLYQPNGSMPSRFALSFQVPIRSYVSVWSSTGIKTRPFSIHK